MEYGTFYNGQSLGGRHKSLRKKHTNEGKPVEGLIEKCRKETLINGVCPYRNECKEKETCQGFHKKNEKKKLNKGSVCRIANKISRPISRKDAFAMAWRIVKEGGYETKVAGVSFENRQEALKRLASYNPQDIHAVLVPENNPYDPNAISVQVMVDNGKGVYKLGYVPKQETVIVKAFLGTVPEIRIIDGDIKGARLRLAA